MSGHDPLKTIPGPNPGACHRCGRWRVAGLAHECSRREPDAELMAAFEAAALVGKEQSDE